MKIVADIDIPFLKGVLEPYAEVVYLKGSAIGTSALKDADALLIRTRTKCNRALLEGAKVKFIASATIGSDHVDLEYLKNNNITFANAPGCNAGAVVQYVFTALYSVACRHGIDLGGGKTLGVVGVGNVGGRVASLAERLGFRVLRNDPPKEAAAPENEKERYCSLEHLLSNSDIITLHVPLDGTTRGMANGGFFNSIARRAVFINASRGEVVDDKALLAVKGKLESLVLDVWNGEPDGISRELLAAADVATPHIAGYSIEGKINGTKMIVRALARHYGITPLLDYEPENVPMEIFDAELPQALLSNALLERFPLYELDHALRNNPQNFEKIRSGYKLRHEFIWK